MSINLELSIYTFTLNEKYIKEQFLDFNEFFRKNFIKRNEDPLSVNPIKYYERFVGEFLDEFEQKFYLNKDKNKGISTTTTNLDFKPHKSVIEGIINGGNTGHGHKIYNILNNEKTEGEISEEQLAALPYYFKIWTPPNSQVGVLMIQSYSIGSINTILTEFIKNIFNKYNVTFNKFIHTPKELKESYLNRSSVEKVTFVTTIEDNNARTKFNRAFDGSDGIKVTISVEKFKKTTIQKFFENFNFNNPIGIDLKELGINDKEDYVTKFYYKDENGRKAHAKLTSKFEIRPTIVLPIEINNEDKTPNLEKIIKFTDDLLEKVKIEVDYKKDESK